MKKLTLKNPLSLSEDKKISTLSFREYTTAADYLSFDKFGNVAQRIALIASISGTDESVIEKLRGPDYIAASRIVEDLLTADELAASDADAVELSPNQAELQKK